MKDKLMQHTMVFFSKLFKKSKKLVKLIITGRSDLVLEGIVQVLKNSNSPKVSSSEKLILTDNVVILTTKHTYYIGHLLQKTLTELGCSVLLSEKFSDIQDIGQLYFVICPQMFEKLPKNFVAFQMEQSISSRWFTHEYFSDLKKAHSIFDYSVSNIEFLIKKDIPYQNIFYLPIGAFSGYRTYLEEIVGYQINQTSEPVEVLFYGDPNCKRRQVYLERLKSEFKVHVASEVFGNELVSLICRAKVVINVHYYEKALLETTRIYETLSLGTPIVSESSIDINIHNDLDGIVSFTPIGDVDAMILEVRLLLTDNLQKQRRINIAIFVEQDHKFSNYFKRFLLSNDLFKYNFNDYKQEVDFAILSESGIPRLCLSLTETNDRRSAFLAKPRYGFEVVEGIRYRQGWIGCGMSYKYVLNKVEESGYKHAIICEDDCVFPDDFERKIDDVISYLRQTKHQWHIFVGLIADLHMDTNILAIEEYEGVEYIHIDRMTSTVMNIYSSEVIKIISLWDHTNKDVQTNTIDRYLESQTTLNIVTTIPYLVGHAEDKDSTLWGISNSQYSEMIEISQQRLTEKVHIYKSSLKNNHT